MNHRRSVQEDSYFVVVCQQYYREDCQRYFSGDDTLVTGFDAPREDVLALLSSFHGVIVSNEISLFTALISSGDVLVVNFTRHQKWLQALVDQKEDWVMVETDGGVDVVEGK